MRHSREFGVTGGDFKVVQEARGDVKVLSPSAASHCVGQSGLAHPAVDPDVLAFAPSVLHCLMSVMLEAESTDTRHWSDREVPPRGIMCRVRTSILTGD